MVVAGVKKSSMEASTTSKQNSNSQQIIDHLSPSVPSITLSDTSKVSNAKSAVGVSQVPTETLNVDLSVISPTKKRGKGK